MSENTVIPAYGASIAIEDSTANLYLREKALDAVQEQVVEDLNDALGLLNGRGVAIESDRESVSELLVLITNARDLAKNALELAWAKTPVDDETA